MVTFRFPVFLQVLAFTALPCLLAAQTSVSLITSPNPSVFGAPVVLTASITASVVGIGSLPTGKVTFYDGVSLLGTATVNPNSVNSSVASLSTILLPAGTRKLTAYYAGDASHSPARSTPVTQRVNAKPVGNFVSSTAISNFPGYQPFVADFNGDGIPDVAAGAQGTGGYPASVFLGDGTGHFRQTFQYPSGSLVAVGDFNGDGKPDIVTSDAVLHVFLGNGDGTFQPAINTTADNLSSNVVAVVADFNGDGKADLAGPFGILLGNGDGTFQAAISLGSGLVVSQIVAGDFNGDGIPDVAITGGSPTLNVFLGHGDGTFSPAIQTTAPGNIFSLSTADFNGDGKDDLAVLCSGSAIAWLSKGDGTFQANTYPVPFGGNLLLSDFNGDGIIDLILDGLVLAGNGDGTFQPLYSLASDYARAVVADFNGDGRPDIFFADGTLLLGTTTTITASGGTPQSAPIGTPFAAPLAVTVLDNGVPVSGATVTFFAPIPFGQITPPPPIATATLSSTTAITDPSGVASVTATASSILGSYTVQARYQSRTASFSLTNVVGPPASLTATGALFQSTAVDTPFGMPLTVVANDSAGNPVAGATVTFQTPQSGAGAVLSSSTAVTDASGKAGVTAKANHVTGSYTVTAAVGGLSVGFQLTNTLGLPSIVTLSGASATSAFGAPVVLTATVTPFNATGRVTFYDGIAILGTKPLSGGTASLSPILLQAGTRKLRALYSGDLSYASSTSNVVTHRVNTAAASGFNPQTLNAPAGGPPVVADFNGDGIADFAYASGTPPSPTVSLGKGDGTFQAPIRTPVQSPGVAGSIAAGDFNGDGIPDLVAGGTVFLGNGDGTFRQGATSTGANSVADFNGDGNADILAGNVILLGKGDGTFVSTSAPAGSSGVGDFNGDGKPDLVSLSVSCYTIFAGDMTSGTYCTYSLQLALGNGDGTFQGFIPAVVAQTRFRTPTLGYGFTISGFVVGDFNGDGKADLLYWGSTISGSPNGLTVLLGNGDGTFGSPQNTSTGVGAATASVTTGDFNGDGIMDVAVVNQDGTFFVQTGKGDGTFQPFGSVYNAQGIPTLLVADFNGDGRADILTAGPSGVTILLGAAAGSVSLTATGGTPQSTTTGTAFPAPLQVRVLNNGVPAPGVAVSFTVPTVGASAILSAPVALTDASGVAGVRATANNIAGSYTVMAGVGSASASFSLTNVSGGISNLAPGKAATQSSTYPATSAAASSAVDGSTDGAFFDGSVTATNADPNAWWQVDLGASASISSIVIWNRTDCCASRLTDYWIFVSDTPFLATDTPATLQNRTGTFASHQTTAPNPSTTITATIQGRYVRVQLSGTDYLSLAEVQVFGTGAAPPPADLAQGKAATQSSTYPGIASAAASSAVDGLTDGAFFDGSVTATNLDPNPWWQVDLGTSPTLNSIVIWNRTDCCASRLSDYWVFVSDTPFLATDTPATLQNRAGTFASHQTTAPSPSTTIPTTVHPCPPGALCPDFLVQGRYVRVQLSSAGYLSLAEVQVFGQ